MTMPDPIPDDLDDWLDGPEPPWDDEPEPPADASRADALIRRLARLVAERAHDAEQVRVHTEQVRSWSVARDEIRVRQESWLRDALCRYHQAVLARDPKALTVHLPAGDLVSRMGRPEWVVDDDFGEWVLPPACDLALDLARQKYETEVARIIERMSPLPGALTPPRVTEPAVSVNGMKDALTRRDAKGKPVEWGVTEQGERPPGVTVMGAERNYHCTPRTADTASTEDDA